MLRRLFLSLIASFTLVSAVWAQDDADLLFDAMGMPQIITIMRDEGLAYGDTIARDMFPSGATPRWGEALSQIYDADQMTAAMRSSFATALEGDDISAMLAFYQSDLGQEIVALEIAARSAMLDPAVEAASKDAAAQAAREDTARFAQVSDFIAANDLIEANVVGALNGNYAFVRGLMAGGGTMPGLSETDLLADIWAQEPVMRASTTEWLYGFLLLAYEPLPDDQMRALVGFAQTDDGQALTAALFTAFDQVFEQISYDLGSAASGFVIAQDI